MSKPLTAIIENGLIKWKRPSVASAFLNSFNGKHVNVTIKEPHKEPSSQEYGYLFGVVLKEYSEFTGYTKSELLDIMKDRHHFTMKEFDGQLIKVRKSISKAKKETDRKELSKLIDLIIMDAAKMGCVISEANFKRLG